MALVIAMLVVLAMATPAASTSADHSTSPVFRIADVLGGTPVPVGSSTLVGTGNGVSTTLDTTALAPGDVVTLWWVVFNDPDDCQAGIPGVSKCGPVDAQLGRGGAHRCEPRDGSSTRAASQAMEHTSGAETRPERWWALACSTPGAPR